MLPDSAKFLAELNEALSLPVRCVNDVNTGDSLRASTISFSLELIFFGETILKSSFLREVETDEGGVIHLLDGLMYGGQSRRSQKFVTMSVTWKIKI